MSPLNSASDLVSGPLLRAHGILQDWKLPCVAREDMVHSWPIRAACLSGKSGWLGLTPAPPIWCHGMLKLLREARSLKLDLLQGPMKVGLLGATWSPWGEGPPQHGANTAEADQRNIQREPLHLWYNVRPWTSNTWSQLSWTFDIQASKLSSDLSHLELHFSAPLQLEEAQLISFPLRSW